MTPFRFISMVAVVLLMTVVEVQPATAAPTSYRTCKQVRIDLGATFASVQARNVTCTFARTFVRQNRPRLCAPGRLKGWRKKFSGVFEDVTLTLIKTGGKRIRTSACGSLAESQVQPTSASASGSPPGRMHFAAAGYKKCKQLRINLRMEFADVQARKVTCVFARHFLVTNRLSLCPPDGRVKGWRRKFSNEGGHTMLTLIKKRGKRIRTDACDPPGAAASATTRGVLAYTPSYKPCKPVTINLRPTKAQVWIQRTTCSFGREFVRKHRLWLCDPGRVKGWRKHGSGRGEGFLLTLSKGSKRIRTDACRA